MKDTTREETILIHALMTNKALSDAVLPHLKPEHFDDADEKHIIQAIQSHARKFSELPDAQAVMVAINNRGGTDYYDSAEAETYLGGMDKFVQNNSTDWLKKVATGFIK